MRGRKGSREESLVVYYRNGLKARDGESSDFPRSVMVALDAGRSEAITGWS